jgi:hypothetical protein
VEFRTAIPHSIALETSVSLGIVERLVLPTSSVVVMKVVISMTMY